MEEEYIPDWLAAVMTKNRAEYEQFMQKVQAKHQDLMQWMQASHEELMQKTMQQIAMAHTHYNTTTSTMMKETHKRDNMTHDAGANMTVDTKGLNSTDTENPKSFGVEKAEIDTGPTSGPFGSGSLFGAHTRSSCSTCIANASIGAASSQSVFFSWMPVFGSSSASVGNFGQLSCSAFGNTSLFGTQTRSSSCDIPFGSTNLFGTETESSSCSSPFGSTCLFGSHTETSSCSSPFGSTSLFGSQTESSRCGSTAYSVPSFEATSMPTFGISTFGQKPFGAISTSACGSISTPVSGTRTPIFGAMNALVYGFPSTPATGVSNSPAIGSCSTHAVGQSNAVFSQSAAAFSGSSTPTFGSNPTFGSSASTSGCQSSVLGTQSITPIFSGISFGQTSFGRLYGTCRLASYTSTPETDSGIPGWVIGKLISISAMPQYKAESHEELRWEDYQLDNEGHSNPASQQIARGNIYFQSAPSLGETTHSFETKFRLGLDRPVSALDSDVGKKIDKYSARLGKFKKRTSTFGKKPSSGGFDSPTPTQLNPSRRIFGQTEPSFGTQPDFGAASTSAFGFTLTPAFGTTTMSFGLTNAPTFGAPSTSAFGFTLSPAISTMTTSFGLTNAPAFGAPSTKATKASSINMPHSFRTQSSGAAVQPAFGTTSLPAFGSTSIPVFGTTTTSFGATKTPAFGAPSTSTGFCTTPVFGLSATAFGATSAPTSGSSSIFGGVQSTTSAFINEGFGKIPSGGLRGSGLTPYTTTKEPDCGPGLTTGIFLSISAMPQFIDESHEELRWVDYHLRNNGDTSFAR